MKKIVQTQGIARVSTYLVVVAAPLPPPDCLAVCAVRPESETINAGIDGLKLPGPSAGRIIIIIKVIDLL